MRLIDADALMDSVNKVRYFRKLAAKRVIDEQPTVDAVPVIRCRDCKHIKLENQIWVCPFGLLGGADFFCAYGVERKEE